VISLCIFHDNTPAFSRRAFLRPSCALATGARKDSRFAVSRLRNERTCTPDLPKSAGGGGRPLRSVLQAKERSQEKEGRGTSADADHYPPHLAVRHAPSRARTPSGVPPRLSPMGLFIPKAQLQARLPGMWRRKAAGFSRRRLAPVLASTSRTGHSAGRLMPEAARKRPAKPFAGTVLARRTGMPPEPPPSQRRGGACNLIGDKCQEGVT